MPSPALTVLRTRQQSVYHFFVRVDIMVVYECLDVFVSRRQPNEVEIHSPNERSTIGRFIGVNSSFGQLSRYELIDWRCRRNSILRRGRGFRSYKWPKRPESLTRERCVV